MVLGQEFDFLKFQKIGKLQDNDWGNFKRINYFKNMHWSRKNIISLNWRRQMCHTILKKYKKKNIERSLTNINNIVIIVILVQT